MEQERYSVLFSSQTGNTKILAQAIAQALPAAGCDYFGDYQGRVPSSPVLFVGFWTDKGYGRCRHLGIVENRKEQKDFFVWSPDLAEVLRIFKKFCCACRKIWMPAIK